MSEHDVRFAIVGAGISGLSTSYHLHHENAVVFEASDHYGGHVYSEVVDGFTWDDGPHFSFASNKYVKQLLEDMVGGEFETLSTRSSNWFQGHWIDHPAQSNLYQVPDRLREECLQSFLATRDVYDRAPANYREWLHQAFGPVFADTFPGRYTRKYWTTDAANLDTDWVGNRVLKPNVDEVVGGAEGRGGRTTSHYISVSEARYPTRGGFLAYCHKMAEKADIKFGKRITSVHFGDRRLRFSDGSEVTYERLVSTMPLKKLIEASDDAPSSVREAAALLRCTEFLRIDVALNHPARRDDTWFYVYDEDKYSTRVSITEKFSPNNAPPGTTGIQVETYGSEYRPIPTDHEQVREKVLDELDEMGLMESRGALIYAHVKRVPQGNPIFDLNRSAAMAEINSFLDRNGVLRVGRYGEWRYLMTDACIISSKRAAGECQGGDADVDASGTTLSDEG
jgi:protoporphyrinogen oxidase